ncbi:ribonuclease III [Bartonella tamiae]|uniref:Ribonuclease 3 n=1 Tax=Bartonella tamiae Th239 TaxID=1094558 RepID=J1JZR8_9HYPH|nr:ribonuclease III [Bartonella tamiae]EJF90632.1 ribonuclease III [Bartonella tamiae Th239]EJF93991.1 ribonuclease III [Bartonella tamiae Th307]
MEHHVIEKLEKSTGHHFKNILRLERALTHASLQDASKGNYERLEFLGDRVLGLLVSEALCEIFSDASEGELSIRLNGLVNAETCAEIAMEIDLPEMIYVGAEMKNLDDRRLANIHADVVEALIAVIYLDGGLDAVRPFIHRYWDDRARQSHAGRQDAKTELQEWAHTQNSAHPNYRIVKRRGPDHDPIFEIEVRISGFAPEIGKGRSKRLAERAAAEKLLIREGVWPKTERCENDNCT